MNPSKYLDQLFISKVRIKALRYFVTHPDEPIHLRGAVRELNEEINAVRRELSRLEEIKLLTSERRGNRKYFHVNTGFLFFDDLRSMIYKTYGLGGDVVKNATKLGEITFAALTQSFMQGTATPNPTGLDLIVVGENITMDLLDNIVTRQEDSLGRHINYTVLAPRDFELHKRRRDTFIMQLRGLRPQPNPLLSGPLRLIELVFLEFQGPVHHSLAVRSVGPRD